MDINLVRKLREDIFTPVSKEDVKARKEVRKQEIQKTFGVIETGLKTRRAKAIIEDWLGEDDADYVRHQVKMTMTHQQLHWATLKITYINPSNRMEDSLSRRTGILQKLLASVIPIPLFITAAYDSSITKEGYRCRWFYFRPKEQ